MAAVACTVALACCDNMNTPIDAETRQKIDSTVVAQNKVAQAKIDSVCKVQRTTLLPLLIDSIKKERLKEIEAQLRTVPK